MSLTGISLCFVILYVIIFYIKHFLKRRNELSGPIPFPILGTLPQLALAGSESHLALHKLGKQYKDSYRLHFGHHEFIILASYDAVKEILTLPQAQGRALLGFLKDRNGDGNSENAIGISISEGDFWATKRPWATKTLREFGFGVSSSMERSSEEGAEELLAEWESKFGLDGHQTKKDKEEYGIVELKDAFNMYTTKLIWKMMVGRLDCEDRKVLVSYLEKNTKYFEAPLLGLSVLFVFPWLKYVIPKLTSYDKVMDAVYEGKNVAKKYFKEFSSTCRKEDKPENFTQAYHKEIQAGNTKNFFEADYQQLFLDLLQGGSDTTASFLELFFYFLAVHKDVQEKIYEEMVQLIATKSNGDDLCLQDLNSLVYLRAVILETYRAGVIVPTPPFRKAMQDIYYKGYKIPKNSILQVNVYSLFYNEAFGEDFNLFRPERFLSSSKSNASKGSLEINELQKLTIPFGLGKRICPGQKLSEVSSFTLIKSVIQRFKILPETAIDGKNLGSLKFGLTVKPPPCRIRLIRRIQL